MKKNLSKIRHYSRLSIGFCLVAILVLGAQTHARDDPPLPPGIDPGGPAIALIAGGIDYTDPEITERLARDGEGQLIGWDLVDNDPLPFVRHGRKPSSSIENNDFGKEKNSSSTDSTKLAKKILSVDHNNRLVVLRASADQSETLKRALKFVALTPARIVFSPHWSSNPILWNEFILMSEKYPKILFIVPSSSIITQSLLKTAASSERNNIIIAASSHITTPRKGNIRAPRFVADIWVNVLQKPDLKEKSGTTNFPEEEAATVAGLAGCVLRNLKKKAHINGKTIKDSILELTRQTANKPVFLIDLVKKVC